MLVVAAMLMVETVLYIVAHKRGRTDAVESMRRVHIAESSHCNNSTERLAGGAVTQLSGVHQLHCLVTISDDKQHRSSQALRARYSIYYKVDSPQQACITLQ
jgi:hypothetical protein